MYICSLFLHLLENANATKKPNTCAYNTVKLHSNHIKTYIPQKIRYNNMVKLHQQNNKFLKNTSVFTILK